MTPDPPTPRTEADIQTSIINALTRNKVGVLRINTIKAKTQTGAQVFSYMCYAGQIDTGLSDLVAVSEGRAWFLEVKRPGQKPRPNQMRFQAWCEWYGMTYSVVTSAEEALQAVGVSDD